MAMDPKLDSLLKALAEGTAKGRMEWTETADENAFRAMFPRSMVRIGRESDSLSAKEYFEILLMDEKGRIVQEWRIDGNPILNLPPKLPEPLRKQNAEFREVEQLWLQARSRARGSERLIDQIISGLQTVQN